MFDRLFTPPTAEELARREREKARKARQQAEQRRLQRERDLQRQVDRQERLASMPLFRVREIREVTVKCENMSDAIALATAAFKEGQSSDHSIKWGKPFGIEGDTIDAIRVVDIRSKQVYEYDDEF